MLDFKWNLDRSIISINNENYNFNTEGFSKNLISNKIDYLNSKSFNFIAKTEIKKDTVKILESNIDIESVLLNLKGQVFNGNIFDLKIDANEQELNKLITHLPLTIQKNWSSFIANGKISFNSSLNGLIDKESNPLFSNEI